jgi:aminotransferase
MGVEKYARKEITELLQAAQISTRARFAPVPDLINLGTGDPDFNQPEFINKAVYNAMKDGKTHYSFAGEPDLKEAIADYYKKYGVAVDPTTQVQLTSGGSQAIFQAFGALLNPGEEVIIMDPAYHGYRAPLAFFGTKMVKASQKKTETGQIRPDLDNIEKSITSKTKAILFCSPDNPSGAVWTREELKGLAEIAVKHDLVVLSDEIYTEFVWKGKHEAIIDLPGMRERTMVLMSFSKTFAWTGCRVGFIIASPELIELIKAVPVGTTGVPVPFQKAAVKALYDGWDFVNEMRAHYKKRIDFMVPRINEIEGVKCVYPEGAFYLFPEIDHFGIPSLKFSMDLLKQGKVRCAPGSQFGKIGEGHLRLAMVRPIEDLAEACDRLERFIKNLPT